MSLRISNNPMLHCSQVREFLVELEWMPEQNYAAGLLLELRSHRLRSFTTWRYTHVEMEGGEIVWRTSPGAKKFNDAVANPQRAILRARLPDGATQGKKLRFRLLVCSGTWAGVDEVLSVWTQAPAAEAVRESGSDCRLPAVAGPVARLGVYAQPAPGNDGKVRVVLVPLDGCGNPARFVRPVPCTFGWDATVQRVMLSGATTVRVTAPQEIGRLRVSVPMTALALDENVANGVRNGGYLVVTGNPVWAALPAGVRPAFGEIHWHTDYSGDGQRAITEAIRCAREELNLDFVAPGDHNPKSEAWRETVAALENANVAGEFATLFGWENSSPVGHENYYFTDPQHPLVCGGSAQFTGGRPDRIGDTLRAHDRFLAIPHHTNTVSEARRPEDNSPWWHPYAWTAPTPAHRLVEIIQARGNQERNEYSADWLGWHQHHGASVQDALDRGYRVGFTGGTDNHCGWPGRAYVTGEGGGLLTPWTQILTGLWTRAVERQAVWDALWERQTWAVVNTRALVWFTVNDVPAGGDLCVSRGAPLNARIRLSAEDSLQSVELISSGTAVWAAAFADPDVDVTVPLGVAEQVTHFYLRARQRNGGLIYASPVFVTVRQ